MSILYLLGKANMVDDALKKLSMGSISHLEDEKKELACKVNRLDKLGVRLVDSVERSILVQSGSKSSLVDKVKENHDSDPIFIDKKQWSKVRKLTFFPKGEMVFCAIG